MTMNNSAAKFDPAMAVPNKSQEGLKFIPFDTPPIRLTGFVFHEPGKTLRRFPLTQDLPHGVEVQAYHTSGGRLDFRSNTRRLWIRVKLHESSHADHMPDTGGCGFDLYIGEPGKAAMLGGSRSKAGSDEYTSALHTFELSGKMENYTINMPLYSGVLSLEIGIDEDAQILPPAPFASEQPIIVYGTSITQGGCASRPGMAYTAILSRYFNQPVLNYGFSGSGRGEPVVAEYLTKIENPAAFILDYEPNAQAEGIRETLETFISILRKKNPETPILVMSSVRMNREIPISGSPEIQAPKQAASVRFQQGLIRRLRKAGDKNLYFINGGKISGKDWHEFSVDGIHQTDLGFYFIAKGLKKVLKKIL